MHGVPLETSLLALKDGRRSNTDTLYLCREVNVNNVFHSSGWRFNRFYLLYDVKDEDKVEDELNKMTTRIHNLVTGENPIDDNAQPLPGPDSTLNTGYYCTKICF